MRSTPSDLKRTGIRALLFAAIMPLAVACSVESGDTPAERAESPIDFDAVIRSKGFVLERVDRIPASKHAEAMLVRAYKNPKTARQKAFSVDLRGGSLHGYSILQDGVEIEGSRTPADAAGHDVELGTSRQRLIDGFDFEGCMDRKQAECNAAVQCNIDPADPTYWYDWPKLSFCSGAAITCFFSSVDACTNERMNDCVNRGGTWHEFTMPTQTCTFPPPPNEPVIGPGPDDSPSDGPPPPEPPAEWPPEPFCFTDCRPLECWGQACVEVTTCFDRWVCQDPSTEAECCETTENCDWYSYECGEQCEQHCY